MGGILVILLGLFLFVAVVLMVAVFMMAVGGHAMVAGSSKEDVTPPKP
jgi:flagellar basal body-associated protein FliL